MRVSISLLLMLSLLALFTGSVSLTPVQVWQSLCGGGDEAVRYIVFESRMPQMFTAILAGAPPYWQVPPWR
ncbi:iron chelate uptake ABC transporter FeCT family permease protein [Prevotella sp. CAG:5226]|nr:iron chelate uptake ABC transporter FeCT family permease protein [Prevotella sp. CAG:5226]